MAVNSNRSLDQARERQDHRRFGVFRVKIYLGTLVGLGALFALIGLLERTISAL